MDLNWAILNNTVLVTAFSSGLEPQLRNANHRPPSQLGQAMDKPGEGLSLRFRTS